jgi:hypothetical protein
MDILHLHRKHMFLKILEKLHIYKNAKLKFILNEICWDVYNPIFEPTLKYEMWQKTTRHTELHSTYNPSPSITAQTTLQDNMAGGV